MAFTACVPPSEVPVDSGAVAGAVAQDGRGVDMNAALGFLARISHDMRSPLNSVLCTSELLLMSHLDERQRALVKAASTSANMLLKLANDVVDLAKVASGRLDLDLHPFNLRSAVGSIIEMLGGQAQAKCIHLSVHFDPLVPQRVLADSLRIQQVLMNLVGNAIKFTHRGGVRVVVGVAPGGAVGSGQRVLRFEVHDTGAGIAASRRSGLFREFSQGDISTARLYGGSGLGLALCRELTELMGGEIDLTSEVGVGSTFRFQVPVTVLAEEHEALESLC